MIDLNYTLSQYLKSIIFHEFNFIHLLDFNLIILLYFKNSLV